MQNSEFAAQIRAVREKLSPSGSWLKGAMYGTHSSRNEPVRAKSKGSVICCWDLLGAFAEVTGETKYPEDASPYVLRAIREQTGKPMTLTKYNDALSTTHSDLLKVLDKAAELAEEGVVCNLFCGQGSTLHGNR